MSSLIVSGDIYQYSVDDILYRIQQSKPSLIEVNSGGGEVFSGWQLGNKINELGIDTICTGLAGSIASFILLSGKKVTMMQNSMLMIHKASVYNYGNADYLEKMAEDLKIIDNLLADFYTNTILKRKGGDAKDVKKNIVKMMEAETFITPQEALDLGLIDEIKEQNVENSNNKYYTNFLNSLNPNNKMEQKQKDANGLLNHLADFFRPKNEATVEPKEVESKETSTLEDTLQSLNDTVSKLSERIGTLENSLTSKESEVENLKIENESLKSEKTNLENSLQDANTKVEVLDSMRVTTPSTTKQFSNSAEPTFDEFKKTLQYPAYVNSDYSRTKYAKQEFNKKYPQS